MLRFSIIVSLLIGRLNTLPKQAHCIFSFFKLLFTTPMVEIDKTIIADTMVSDIVRAGSKKLPGFLRDHATSIPDLRNTAKDKTPEEHKEKNARNKRQKNHIQE